MICREYDMMFWMVMMMLSRRRMLKRIRLIMLIIKMVMMLWMMKLMLMTDDVGDNSNWKQQEYEMCKAYTCKTNLIFLVWGFEPAIPPAPLAQPSECHHIYNLLRVVFNSALQRATAGRKQFVLPFI